MNFMREYHDNFTIVFFGLLLGMLKKVLYENEKLETKNFKLLETKNFS